jgi:hypothetical protein
MVKVDLTQGIDFKPLTELGIEPVGGVKLLLALSPLIDLEFQTEVKAAFTAEELAGINQEALEKGLKPETGFGFLEEKYHAKTEVYFPEVLRKLYNRYVKIAADLIVNVRQNAAKLASAGQADKQEFERLMANKDWEGAAEKMKQILKEKNEF